MVRSTLLGVLTLAVLGCGPKEEEPGDATPTPTQTPTPSSTPISFQPSCFEGGAEPQLDLDGPVENWTWNDPHVLKVGDEYWMYASSTDFFDFPVRLYRLVSSNGVDWTLAPETPILADAPPGQWDSGGMETPAVVFHDGLYHLFYTAYPVEFGEKGHTPFDYRFGYATSTDGVTFTRVGNAPLVDASGTDADASNDWYQYVVGEPGPVVVDGALTVYFTAVGVDADLAASLQVIGSVRSTDGGLTWSAPERVMAPDQTLYPRDEGWIGYSTPNAIAVGGEVHLFFDVASQPEGGDWQQLRIHHALSPDGRTGWVHDPEEIVAAPFLDWAVDEVLAPHALLDGDQLRMWFAGHELDGVLPEHFAIGMMTCEL